MGAQETSLLVKALMRWRIHSEGVHVLFMELTFKENCPDLRNTKVTDIIYQLR